MTDEMIYDACQQEYRSGYSDAMADCAEEISRLKAERDAAVADLKKCYNCEY